MFIFASSSKLLTFLCVKTFLVSLLLLCLSLSMMEGWFNETNLFKVYSENNLRNTIKLHNVYYRGYDRDTLSFSYSEVHQIIAKDLVSSSAATGSINDILVEYDWSHRGTTEARPSGLDTLVGVGFIYYNTTTNRLEIWNGTTWRTI